MKTKGVAALVSGILSAVVINIFVSSCERTEYAYTEDIQEVKTNATLMVRATLPTNGENVCFPVRVYVFKGNKCEAMQVIANENEIISMPLLAGTYNIQAIAGASEENYVLPSIEEATPSMPLTLRNGQHHSDLQVAAIQNVKLEVGEQNMVTLTLQRVVMQLKNVTIQGIPQSTNSVSLSLSPLYEGMTGTTLSGNGTEVTLSLEKNEDGTWILPSPIYLLPAMSSPVIMKVSLQGTENDMQSYTYSSSEQMEAGLPINIVGTYTDLGVTLSGILTGDCWKDEKTISFNFGPNAQQPSEPVIPTPPTDVLEVDKIPTAGTTYQSCLVLAVDGTEVDGVWDVLLLSPTQKELGIAGTISSMQVELDTKVQELLPLCSVDGIEGWRVMTLEEANIMRKNKGNFGIVVYDSKTAPQGYVYKNTDNELKVGRMGLSVSNANDCKITDLFRPVTIIKMKLKTN
ncbi:MAG: FimB/Mfa2 family fimbrial subunit [Bacteroidaceae bacterium]|nr:FimB/Mfa2 family fimbrial subunit [Bacteroidaceae bacterium]